MEQKKNNSSWIAMAFFVFIIIIMFVSNLNISNDTGKKTSAIKNNYNSNMFNVNRTGAI